MGVSRLGRSQRAVHTRTSFAVAPTTAYAWLLRMPLAFAQYSPRCAVSMCPQPISSPASRKPRTSFAHASPLSPSSFTSSTAQPVSSHSASLVLPPSSAAKEPKRLARAFSRSEKQSASPSRACAYSGWPLTALTGIMSSMVTSTVSPPAFSTSVATNSPSVLPGRIRGSPLLLTSDPLDASSAIAAT